MNIQSLVLKGVDMVHDRPSPAITARGDCDCDYEIVQIF